MNTLEQITYDVQGLLRRQQSHYSVHDLRCTFPTPRAKRLRNVIAKELIARGYSREHVHNFFGMTRSWIKEVLKPRKNRLVSRAK